MKNKNVEFTQKEKDFLNDLMEEFDEEDGCEDEE